MLTINQEKLDHLIKIAPHRTIRKRTSFDISGTDSKELVISRWYQYYLDQNEDHGLGNLFVDSLMELADNRFEFKQYIVLTEQKTVNGNFIDILIEGIGEDHGKFIVIENKIYHHIHNDLEDYLNHCISHDNKRLGVLLTLNAVPQKLHGDFQNILHIQWINKVLQKIQTGSYTLNSEQKHHLDNFIDTIKNLNRYSTMDNTVSFYIQNTEAINGLIKFKEETIKYITHQLDMVAGLLDMKLENTDSPRLRSFILPELDSELGCSVIFDKVFEPGNELRISVGLRRKNLHRVRELDELFAVEIDNTDLVRNYHPGIGWHNYITKHYKLNEEICSDLSNFVADQIRTQFWPLVEKIGNYLKLNN